MSEEIVKDDPEVEEDTTPVSDEELNGTPAESDSTEESEEQVVASGSDIIVEKQSSETEEEHEQRLYKYVFPHAFARRYGDKK